MVKEKAPAMGPCYPMEQRSEEWFKARVGRITGSRVGALLGLSPYQTKDDVIRAMVREYHGADPEFTGNVATEYGTFHEAGAIQEYEWKTGNKVKPCGFFPFEEWLGASPDGLVGDDGLIEVKCPYGKNVGRAAQEQLHYYAQMQIEMYCAGRAWCDFWQWSPEGATLERVERDDDWLADHLPLLRECHALYLAELDNPDHLAPKRKVIETERARLLLDEYDQLIESIDLAKDRKQEVFDELVSMAGDRNADICGRKMTRIDRKGSVDYKKVPELKGVDLEPYRKKPTSFWKLS